MRVAVIIDTWFPFIGGGQINAWEISKRLASLGIKIDIITRNNGKHKNVKIKNLRIFKLGKTSPAGNSVSKILFTLKALLFLYKNDYDLVHAHAFLPGIAARLIMVFKGTPSVHGTSINSNLNGKLSKMIEKFILTQILYSTQITVSRDFLEIKNINKKIIYIPNAIDIKHFEKINPKKIAKPTIICVGKLHPQKNLNTIIKSISKVQKEIPNINLLIVGKGPEEIKLKKMVKSLGLGENIKFLGQITGNNLIKLYKSSTIFLQPSIYEGQSLALLEAWASKLPVMASKVGDNVFLIENAKNGYLINDPHSVQEIAKLIIKTLRSKNLKSMGENGYNLVKNSFSWEKTAASTLKVYENINKS